MGIQPVKVNGSYVFNDDEILAEMEMFISGNKATRVPQLD